MLYIKIFITCLMCTLLAACAPKVVYVPKPVAYDIPAHYRQLSNVPEPKVSEQQYLLLSCSDQQIQLARYILALQKTIGQDRLIFNTLLNYLDEQRIIIQTPVSF